MHQPPLATLQSWFLHALGSGLPLQEFAPQQLILPEGEDVERLGIYSRAYVLRLQECLEADYPLTAALMGPELFSFFCGRYIRQSPSRSPSLYDFGEGFADFLQRTQPQNVPQPDPALAFPVALARLERGLHRVMRAPGLEPSSQTAAGRVNETAASAAGFEPDITPFGALSGLLRRPEDWQVTPCLQLMESPFPLRAYWMAARQMQLSEPDAIPCPPLPAPEPSCIALTRQHYRVQVLELERWQYLYLQALSADKDQELSLQNLSEQHSAAELEAEIAVWSATAAAQSLIMPRVQSR